MLTKNTVVTYIHISPTTLYLQINLTFVVFVCYVIIITFYILIIIFPVLDEAVFEY
jgi:hypothetical protein